MTKHDDVIGQEWRRSFWRIAGWGLLALLLLAPLVAMQFTEEVDWTASDFVIMGVMLLLVGLGFELAIRMSSDVVYRAAFGLAVLAGFLLVWANLAVGIIGAEDNPANAMYLAVLAVGVAGAILVRGQPRGMAETLIAMATVQALIAVIAMMPGLGAPSNGPLHIAAVNGFFIALFVAAAGLFHVSNNDGIGQLGNSIRGRRGAEANQD